MVQYPKEISCTIITQLRIQSKVYIWQLWKLVINFTFSLWQNKDYTNIYLQSEFIFLRNIRVTINKKTVQVVWETSSSQYERYSLWFKLLPKLKKKKSILRWNINFVVNGKWIRIYTYYYILIDFSPLFYSKKNSIPKKE